MCQLYMFLPQDLPSSYYQLVKCRKEGTRRSSSNCLVPTTFRKGSEHGHDHLSMTRLVSVLRCQSRVKVVGFNILKVSVGEP